MSRISQSGLSVQKTPAPVSAGAKHFDTFETKFFEQGEAGDGERFEYVDEAHYPDRSSLTRSFLLGVGVGGVAVTLLGGVGLWLAGARFGQPQPVVSAPMVEPASPPPSPTLPAPPTAVPAPPAIVPAVVVEPLPSPQPAVAVNDDPVAAPAPAPAAVPAANAEPSAAAAAAPEKVAPAPAVAVPPAPVAAAAAPAAPKPAAEAPVEKPSPIAAVGLGPVPSPVAANENGLQARCKRAIDGRRTKDLLAACPAAFAAEPAASIAVALAKVEFDRGRSAKALEWGRKAVAIDADAADAYVFIGGGEQMAGHGKAAMDAYRRYLELAPSGRYARDVRSIVGSAR